MYLTISFFTHIQPQNSIMDELLLANEHIVFKWTSLDPGIKCSEVVASINVNKVTPEVITTITNLLRETMPVYGLECCIGTSDAAGCNWVAMRDMMSTHSYCDVLSEELRKEYPTIDFDVKCVYKDDVTGDFGFFVPDMLHLTKNIATALELSSSKSSKRNIKRGKCPVNAKMIEDVWLEMGGATGQFHETKLTFRHFQKNSYSRMDVLLAVQLLALSVALMIRNAIADEEVKLPCNNKVVYHHLANLCERWNEVFDICNGKDGPHTPENAKERQTKLLRALEWFTEWKASHDTMVAKGEADEYNFFAPETWFCIRALLLGHIAVIQYYCLDRGESINPSSMNTDVVEWFFGDARQMMGGSTNKLNALGFNRADQKSNAFNAAKSNLVGNNAHGKDHFNGRKKW